MLKKIKLIPGIFVCMLAVGPIAASVAGEVKLVSDTIDVICRVDVTSDLNDPNAKIETYTDVAIGWSITKPEKLCYRRASTPNICDTKPPEHPELYPKFHPRLRLS